MSRKALNLINKSISANKAITEPNLTKSPIDYLLRYGYPKSSSKHYQT